MGQGLRRTAFDQSSYEYWTRRYGVVNVKDYGAVGNGRADDTAAIQDAITAVPNSGGVVRLPAGTYRISSSLSITESGVTLAGDGMFATEISVGGSFDAVSISNAATGTRVTALEIVASVTQTSGAGIKADSTGNAVYISLIDNVYFSTFNGIELYNTNTTTILHCRMNNQNYGLYCGNGCSIVRFTNAEVGGGAAGVFLDGGCASIKLLQVEIFTNGHAVALDAVNGASAPDYVYMYDVEANPGSAPSGPYFYLNDAGEVHLVECWSDGGPQAIQINSGTVTILGGRFGDGASPVIGIAGGQSITIIGSSIAGSPNSGTGIGITGGGNVRVIGCIFGLFGDALGYAVAVASTYTGSYSVSSGGTTGNILIEGCSLGHTSYQQGNGYEIQCAADLVLIRDTYGANPYASIAPPASPLVSGTAYQNTSPVPITIYQPAYATASGTSGTVAVALGSTDTPSAIYTKQIPGSTTSAAPDVCTVRVPPGWYFSFTTSGATLLNANFQGE